MDITPLETKELPKPLKFSKLVGPSFIILGLGLGTGELILWPYLTSKFGMGIIWGAIIGITFQFFMNMEIERYALAHGESIFVGFARKLKKLPIWFVLSTFIPWVWPGTAAASAQILGHIMGIEKTYYIAIALLIMVGLALSLGRVVYKTQEFFQKYITIIGVPSIFILVIILARGIHWQALANGVIGIGDGYRFLPLGIPIASFLGALAYAGAGGNLNLSQSFYIREKGYGMGKYTGTMKGLLSGKTQNSKITGQKFEPTKDSIYLFNQWWKSINLEHFLVFWMTGALTISFLGLLAFITVYGKAGDTSNLNFIFLEAEKIKELIFPTAGVFFLIVAAITLFGTQLGVLDSTSRIISENIILYSNKLKEKDIPKVYYATLWTQILTGIIILSLGLREPMQLIITAAVLNAFAMFVHVGLTLWTNMTLLDKKIRPNVFRILIMLLAFVFYGGFSIYTLIQYIF